MRIRVLLATLATAAVAITVPTAASAAITDVQDLGPGVTLSHFTDGAVTGELISVNLADPRVSVDLLHPSVVAEREQTSQMVADAGAVAGVNADFFNISETHAGVTPTGSSDGPEVTGYRPLKAAVPNSQRFGPAMAPGTSTRDVIGVGADGRARVGSLTLVGTVRFGGQRLDLGGLNQYALPQGSIGAYTADWGTVSRERAVCGSDTSRLAPCVTDTAEVTVRQGRVVAVSATPGEGPIAADSVVLVGREAGADMLRTLAPGDPVSVDWRLAGPTVPYRFAVGGAPILSDGATLAGVDAAVKATRTGAGVSADGRRLYLVTLDGNAEAGGGLSLADLAGLLAGFGAADGVNLDGGGSTTCAYRTAGSVSLCNALPTGVAERAVANGIGVFIRR